MNVCGMIRWACAPVLVGFMGCSALAQGVPADIARYLKPMDVQPPVLRDGTVRVQSNRSVVTADTARSVVFAYCAPVWTDRKRAWDGRRLRGVEVLNSIGAQGYAFPGGREECIEAGNGSDLRKFLAPRLLVCVAGNPCRARRPGEVVAGDS